ERLHGGKTSAERNLRGGRVSVQPVVLPGPAPFDGNREPGSVVRFHPAKCLRRRIPNGCPGSRPVVPCGGDRSAIHPSGLPTEAFPAIPVRRRLPPVASPTAGETGAGAGLRLEETPAWMAKEC